MHLLSLPVLLRNRWSNARTGLFVLLVLTLMGLMRSTMAAPPPALVHYQGSISVDGIPFNGTGRFKFALVDVRGRSFWSNDGTSKGADEPIESVRLRVVNGVFSVNLGDTALEMAPLDAERFVDLAPVNLHVWFDDNKHGFQRLEPPHLLASAAYALTSATVASGGVTTAAIAQGAVTESRLANGAVTAAKLSLGAVTASIGRGTISGSQLADGAIGARELSKAALGAVYNELGMLTLEGQTTFLSGDSLSLPLGVSAADLTVAGSTLYVLEAGLPAFDRLALYDVSDPSNITPLGGNATNLSLPRRVVVDGGIAYVTDDGTNVLQLFDVSNPGNVVALDSDGSNISSPRGLVVEGGIAYVADSENDLLARFDVSNPNAIAPLDPVSTGLVAPQDVVVLGDIALVVASAAIHAFDVSNPNDVKPIGSFDAGFQAPIAMDNSGSTIFVVDFTARQLRSFDATDPSQIIALDTLDVGSGAPLELLVASGLAFVKQQGTNGLKIYDVRNPADITSNGTLGASAQPSSFSVGSGFLYRGLNPSTGADYLDITSLVPQVTVRGRLFVEDSIQTLGSVTASAFNTSSDVSLKRDFAPIDADAVLGKVASLPISEWRFEHEEQDVRHVGPTAQAFRAAFGLGRDDRHIATVDADGVALAAIQALIREVEGLRAEVTEKAQSVDRLSRKLQRLEQRIEGLAP